MSDNGSGTSRFVVASDNALGPSPLIIALFVGAVLILVAGGAALLLFFGFQQEETVIEVTISQPPEAVFEEAPAEEEPEEILPEEELPQKEQ